MEIVLFMPNTCIHADLEFLAEDNGNNRNVGVFMTIA